MRRFTGRRPSAAAALARLNGETMRNLIAKIGGAFTLADAYDLTHNRDARRMFARGQRSKGRGYTTPRHGRAHTRGSGRT